MQTRNAPHPILNISLIGALALSGLAACGGPDTTTAQQDSIVGGTVDQGHPAVVFIRSKDLLTGGTSICTGTLIDPQLVLTAGHCINPPGRALLRNFEVAFGTERDPFSAEGWQAVSDEVVHPGWNPNAPLSNGNDIAVMVLASPVNNIEPMSINRDALTNSMLGQPVIAVGWGTVDRNDFGSAGLKRKVDVALNSFDRKFIKTGRPGETTCGGDSGGPHLMNFGGQERIIGVTSFGPTQCDQGESTQTRVDAFASWIDEQIARHGLGTPPPANNPPANNPPANNPPTNNPPPAPQPTGFGVDILSPSAGDRFEVGEDIIFSGIAGDTRGNNVSAEIVWRSNIDGVIGEGAEFAATLSEGNHSISAQIRIGNSQASKSINVAVGDAAGGNNGIPPEVCARYPFICN